MALRDKPLFEQETGAMSLDLLGYYQGSLIAKLIAVNDELHHRYQNLSSLARPPHAVATRGVSESGVERLRRLNEILRAELDHNSGRSKPAGVRR